ncbi:MAG: 4-alpha-glucanotransferase [Eubacteriales bacterium]|nr:4-alpha-glucanotransferase [Eubacteriales bacterium]
MTEKKQSEKTEERAREAGILLPVFSLPSAYTQGCFSDEAYRFVDFLSDSGVRWWQILPLEPADECFSPYRPESCFALDPAFIDPKGLLRRGWLTENEFQDMKAALFKARWLPADGPASASHRLSLSEVRKIQESYFHIAYQRYTETKNFQPFFDFITENKEWLPDFALYRILKKRCGTGRWQEWPEPFKSRTPDGLERLKEECQEEFLFECWKQYVVRTEWDRLHRYVNKKGIRILGDLPIYAAEDSSDCWSHPEIFQLDPAFRPKQTAGVPPDYFSEDGQLWGNPLYRWENPDCTSWWIRRFREKARIYDSIRIDHFRGFEAYYAVPAGKTAREGHWEKGPGFPFFQTLFQSGIPDIKNRLIAEDLGFLTDAVRELLSETGLPGMKVLEFAFDSDESNPYLPENCPKNAVIYTGTHDNDTARGWYESAPKSQKEKFRLEVSCFLKKNPEIGSDEKNDSRISPSDPILSENFKITEENAADAMLLLAAMSRPFLSVFPMQDVLNLGSSARINIPGSADGNWNWQLSEGAYTPEHARKLRALLVRAGRA